MTEPACFGEESRWYRCPQGAQDAGRGLVRSQTRQDRAAGSSSFRDDAGGTPRLAEACTIPADQRIRHSAIWRTVFGCLTWGEVSHPGITDLGINTDENRNHPSFTRQANSLKLLILTRLP